MVQFNNLLYQLSRRLTWETQVAAIPAGNKLDSKYNPLSVNPDDIRNRQRKDRRESGENINNGESLESFEKRLRFYVK